MPVRILRRPTVVWGNAAGLVAFLTETSLVFLLTLYLQEVLGYTPLATGLAFGVLGLGTVLGGTLGGRVTGRIGSRATIVYGGVAQAVATARITAVGGEGPGAVLSGVRTAVGVNAALVLAGALAAGALLGRREPTGPAGPGR